MEQTHPSDPIFLRLVPVAQVADKAAMDLVEFDVRAAEVVRMDQTAIVVLGVEGGVLPLDTDKAHIVRSLGSLFIIASASGLVDQVQR